MAFNNVVYLISGGVNYYISGSTNANYTGSGTPWTTEAGTPYRLSWNDGTPIWVPGPGSGQMIYGGGPPFSNGQRPIDRSYPNVTEVVGLQMYANSADNAALLLRQLRQILNTALSSVPCVLAVQGGTNTAYYEIYAADVAETNSYQFLGNTTTHEIRATITWTRSFMGGRLSTGETLFNATTFTNTGTGGSNDTQAYATGTGDLINEGGPLNLLITAGVGTFGRLWAGSVASRTYDTTGAAAYSTSSQSGLQAYAITHTLTSLLTKHRLRPRVLVRTSTNNTNIQLAIRVTYGTGVLYIGPWVDLAGGGGVATLTDLGTYPVDIFYRRSKGITAPTASVQVWYRSKNGSSASVTTTYTELLLYSTFAQLDTLPGFSGGTPLLIDVFQEQTDAVCLPHAVPSVLATSGSIIQYPYDYRGVLPLYYAGDSLYVAWLDGSMIHSTTATSTVTCTHASLYHTLRGGI